MKTSRSLLYGYSKCFGFFILFTMGSLVGTAVTAEETPATADLAVSLTSVPRVATEEQKEDVNITPSSGEHSETSPTNTPGSKDTVIAPKVPETTKKPSQAEEEKEMTTALDNKDTTLAPKLHPIQTHAVTMSLVSRLVKKASSVTTLLPHPNTEGTSAAQGTIGDILDTSTSPDEIIHHTHAQATVGQKYPATPGKKKTSGETTATVSTALRVTSGPEIPQKPRWTEEETETTAPVKNISDNITTGAAGRNPPVVADKESEWDSTGASSSGKSHIIIILAVAFCILCLLAISVFLYRRHRNRSGSTSFNTAGWAGQVALPDDSGLDKDIEPGTVTASGEGEPRRNTLVTFSGKRQSRVPSVAMEDISGKREREECQQLLGGEAGQGSGPEGSREANGKLPEHTTQSSEEASTTSKPEGGSS